LETERKRQSDLGF